MAPSAACLLCTAPMDGTADAEQASLQDLINAKLVQSGERERLKRLLRERLVECGWRDELKEQCKRIVKERGFENITTDELAKEITPVGRATVPVRRTTRARPRGSARRTTAAPRRSLVVHSSLLFSQPPDGLLLALTQLVVAQRASVDQTDASTPRRVARRE